MIKRFALLVCILLISAAAFGAKLKDVNYTAHKKGDEYAHYVLADSDEGATSYYGYVSLDTNFYILKITTSGATKVYAYRRKQSGEVYATQWTNRASLTYQRYDLEFG